MHQQQDIKNLEPIVEKIIVRIKRKKIVGKLSDDDVWLEVAELPSFNVKSEDKLLLPNHVFVTERVYRKIQKQEALK